MHLFHGFALGVLFAILAGFILPLSFWTLTTAGVAYSFVLWLIIPFSFRRVFENAGRTRFTRDGMMVALTAHLIYGIVLGAVLSVIQ